MGWVGIKERRATEGAVDVGLTGFAGHQAKEGGYKEVHGERRSAKRRKGG